MEPSVDRQEMLHPRCPEPVKVLLAAFVLVFGVLQELKSSGRSVPAIHEASGKIDVASPEYFSCTIPRENRLSCEEFAENYLGKQPVVLKGLGHSMARFAGKCSHEALLESPRYGSLRVNVSTANAFTGRTLKEVNVHEYLQKFLLPQDLNKQGNETYYLFGGHHGRLWQEFLDDYEVPPFPTESLRSVLGADTSVSHKTLCASVDKLVTSLSFGIAGRNTVGILQTTVQKIDSNQLYDSRQGVPFHFHGPGFLQVIYGRKRWLLVSTCRNHLRIRVLTARSTS